MCQTDPCFRGRCVIGGYVIRTYSAHNRWNLAESQATRGCVNILRNMQAYSGQPAVKYIVIKMRIYKPLFIFTRSLWFEQSNCYCTFSIMLVAVAYLKLWHRKEVGH
jgi:hypothetical protein